MLSFEELISKDLIIQLSIFKTSGNEYNRPGIMWFFQRYDDSNRFIATISYELLSIFLRLISTIF